MKDAKKPVKKTAAVKKGPTSLVNKQNSLHLAIAAPTASDKAKTKVVPSSVKDVITPDHLQNKTPFITDDIYADSSGLKQGQPTLDVPTDRK